MSTASTFLPTNMSHVDQNNTDYYNFNPICTYMTDHDHIHYGHDDDDDDDDQYLVPEFDLSEYFAFLDQSQPDQVDVGYSSSSFTPSTSLSPPGSQELVSSGTTTTAGGYVESSLNPMPVLDGWKRSGGGGGGKMNAGELLRVAFRMKTQLEIVDDGYKWRKYGKKRVKTNRNPRNYYKCSNGGCSVKKRIERDGEDSDYVITTYDGVHNHASPACYYSATSSSCSYN